MSLETLRRREGLFQSYVDVLQDSGYVSLQLDWVNRMRDALAVEYLIYDTIRFHWPTELVHDDDIVEAYVPD